MGRTHLWFMGLVATLFGVVLVADYAMVQYRVDAYLNAFTPDQQAWFTAIPAYVDGIWGAQAVLALLGGVALLIGARASVWLLGFSLVFNVALTVWLLWLAQPSMLSVTGWLGGAVMAGSVALSLLFWLYARGEKQNPEGVL